MAVFYETARKRYVEKWYKMMVANTPADKKIKLYKKLPDGSTIGREVTKEEWSDEEGYKVVVQNKQQRIADKTENISLMIATKQQYPDNAPLNKAIQKRMITILDLSPQEMEEIEQFEADRIQELVRGVEQPEQQTPPQQQTPQGLPLEIEAGVEKVGGTTTAESVQISTK